MLFHALLRTITLKNKILQVVTLQKINILL